MLIEQDNLDSEIDHKQLTKYVSAILKAGGKKDIDINPYFEEMKFHTDYRDTLNAFNLLVPNQKQLFNRSDLPLTNTCSPPVGEIRSLIVNFIKETNKIIKNYVSDELNMQNGWQDNTVQKKFKDSFNHEMNELGLPQSLYKEPKSKAPIKLIKLDHAEKYETENEIKYIVFLIIQKKNVQDQMVIKVSFVIDREDLNLDREFFDKKKTSYSTSVKIEEVSIIGFLSNHSFGKKSARDKFYDFNKITDGRMFKEHDIIKMLNAKKLANQKEQHL
jgi:hypothetical protein